MRHPSEGVLRRLLDEPAGVADADRTHVAACTECLGTLTIVRRDAALAGSALATDPEVDVDVAAAWARMATAAAPTAPSPRASAPPLPSRLRAVLVRPAAAALAVSVVLTGAGTAAANNWLEIFRTEQVAPVSFTPDDLIALPDLTGFGDVAFSGDPDLHEVADAATAESETGLDVPQVSDLPRGVSGDPVLQVGRQVSATFTFSAVRATRAAAAEGTVLPPPPAGLDGSRVRLVAGPGLAQLWASSSGAPALLVGRAVAPRAYSSGVPFEVVRDYLLSLPGLTDDVAAQLRGFAADGSTLPLPVPSDQVTTSSAEVDGVSATVLEARDRTMAAVVWVDDGIVTVVAGSLGADEVLDVAEDLE